LEKVAEHALDVARKLGVQYADIRIIDQSTESIETKNHDVAAVDLGASTGVLPARKTWPSRELKRQ
jgi:predicted Zn-dependent protease